MTTQNPKFKTDALISEDIDAYLETHQHKSMLRFITCGSVDDGKSTLIGRLLYDSKMIFEDQLAALEADSKKLGTQGQNIDFALLVDGLAAERVQDAQAEGGEAGGVAVPDSKERTPILAGPLGSREGVSGRLGPAGADWLARTCPAFPGCASTFPRNQAPSAIAICGATMSPSREPVARISTFSVAVTSP